MNDRSLDPELRSLEARLEAITPRVSAEEQQRLLYDCAFAAGKKRAGAALNRWLAVAGLLAIVWIVSSAPWTAGDSNRAERKHAPRVASEEPSFEFALLEEAFAPRKDTKGDLDAWRVPASPTASLAAQLDEFNRTDSHLRSLSVGTMTRSALSP